MSEKYNENDRLEPKKNKVQPPKSEKEKNSKGEESRARVILDYVISIAFAVGVALLINTFILLNARIPSGSMETTIMTGDRIFGFRLSYLFKDPQRYDIVIFKYPDDESTNYIKRIIGLPGETIEVKEGRAYLVNSDGSLTALDAEDAYYLHEEPRNARNSDGIYKVPEGSYFMMGDNRNHSSDSRFWKNKFVAKDKILAKAFFRYWGGFKIIR